MECYGPIANPEIQALVKKMNLCMCGWGTEYEVVKEGLEYARRVHESKPGDPFIGLDDMGEFRQKVLDSWGLLEHGTSVGGSWLTDDGKVLLAWFDEHGTNADEWPREEG